MESLILIFTNIKLLQLLYSGAVLKAQFVTQRLTLAEYEHIINNLDSLFKVSLMDTYDNIKLT